MKTKRIKELIEILNEAAKVYYQENREIMSNLEYDKLYDELESLEKEAGVIYPQSPTQRVGYEVLGSLLKVPHESPMLSLDKTKEVAKLESFLGEREGLLSWKLDGLTIVLRYENGVLVQAVTRGNGTIGEDITHNAKVFKNLPLKINHQGNLRLRGEAIISYSEFEKINEKIDDGSEKYKNPRNLTSGTVRQLNSEIAAERNVYFFAFSVVNPDVDFSDSKEVQLSRLKDLGFDVVYFEKVTGGNIAEAVAGFEKKVGKNDFGSDGLVLTYDSISYGNSLGSTSKFPKDSIAFKWADEVVETTLLKIEWNTSRTGLINPIAVFEPVEIEGTTVEKASLHNLSILKALKLGLGDTITVYKANMIIPQVLDNLTKSDTLEIPGECPVCNSPTIILKLKDAETLNCTNPNCKAQIVRSLSHFASRDAMNIEGLSEATFEKFVENGFTENYLDIYKLSEHEEEIKGMEGFGERSYKRLIEAIESSKDVELANFIYALGINQVGLSNAKLLVKHYDYDVVKISEAAAEDLQEIGGYGEIIAQCIADYFKSGANRELFFRALEILRIKIPQKADNNNEPLRDKVFVITGDLQEFKNRKELVAEIEALGGKVTGSVSKKTDFLINNDPNSQSSKNKKANELKIPIISEKDFIEMANKK